MKEVFSPLSCCSAAPPTEQEDQLCAEALRDEERQQRGYVVTSRDEVDVAGASTGARSSGRTPGLIRAWSGLSGISGRSSPGSGRGARPANAPPNDGNFKPPTVPAPILDTRRSDPGRECGLDGLFPEPTSSKLRSVVSPAGSKDKLDCEHSNSESRSSGRGSHPSRRKRPSTEVKLEPGDRLISFDVKGWAVNPPGLNEMRGGHPNRLCTAKYTPLTWLPKSLYQQFHRAANIYFAFIAVLTLFEWSPKDWMAKIPPFALVLSWTALKDLHEDMRRRRDDRLENKRTVLRFNFSTKKFEPTAWADVLVGDILVVTQDGGFPADLILLRSSNEQAAYISTANLDGETSLKERHAPAIIDALLQDSGTKADAQQISEQDRPSGAVEVQSFMRFAESVYEQELALQLGRPQADLRDVRGILTLQGENREPCPTTELNFLPRGCVLRNTAWILAVAAYCGQDTKAMLNNTDSVAKVSNMQVYLNQMVRGLLAFIFLLCTLSATVATLTEGDNEQVCCLQDGSTFRVPDVWHRWLLRFFVFCVTFYHVVPMSLYVVFELLKLGLGYQVNTDQQMVDPETGLGAVARTADLMEEMGQINFVFSDKTGTLTRNEMVFARCFAGGQDLGDFRAGWGGSVPPGLREAQALLTQTPLATSSLATDVRWFFTCLSLCHSCQVELLQESPVSSEAFGRVEPASPSTTCNELTADVATMVPLPFARSPDGVEYQYTGMSPDEVALVRVASEVGISFASRVRQLGASSSILELHGPKAGERCHFLCLHELEFTSARKRMSVIVQCTAGPCRDEIWCITKGADNVIGPLLTQPLGESCKEYLRKFSQEGLRTLVISAKKVDSSFYTPWAEQYRAAEGRLDGTRDHEVARVAALMETDLTFAGITAVEDRLQEGVSEAIDTMKQAGIRVWVLTGDKLETAVDIAKSCALFSESTTLCQAIDAHSAEEAFQALKRAREAILKANGETGLVLDGQTLQYAVADQECRALIYELGLSSRSCVCCRLSPMQKRQLVDLVRQAAPRTITLAIGDGANDVPMIECAHLGIGVRGKEGAAAVQVSDIAISQFRFLVPLLQCHGRRAYRRMSLFLCWYLYKNVVLAMGDIIWMQQNKYKGGIAFPEYLTTGYNVCFTSLHILFVLGLDLDVPDALACAHPELYLVGPRRGLFNRRIFAKWMVQAAVHGSVLWLVPNLWIDPEEYVKEEPVDFWLSSATTFTAIIIIVNAKLILCSVSRLKASTLLPSLAALLSYAIILCLLCYWSVGNDFQPSMAQMPERMFTELKPLVCMFILPLGILLVDSVDLFLQYHFSPTPLQDVRSKWRAGAL